MEQVVLSNLVKVMKSGNLDVFHEFYERTKEPIFYNLYALIKSREISEDLLHDTFVKFLKEIKSVDENGSILGYLMSISRNLALDYIKKNRRVEALEDEQNVHSHDTNSDIEAELLLDKIKKILKANEFEIFVLHVLNELSFKEIAKIKHRPIGTILSSYHHALKKIKKEVKYETL